MSELMTLGDLAEGKCASDFTGAKATGEGVKEDAAEKLVYPNISEILDVNDVFKNIASGFLRISKNISKASGLLKDKVILNTLVLEDEDEAAGNQDILDNLLNVQLSLDLESIFYNIYELQIITAIKKRGIVFQYDLIELNMTIENIKAAMVIINNNVSRLTSSKWWTSLQQSDRQGNPDFKIQVIYCGIADACTRFLESVKAFKEIEGSKIVLGENDLPILNLAPPIIKDSAKEYYDKYFPERVKAKVKIGAKANKMQADFKARGMEDIFKDFNVNSIF
jgi:hypothetical protein